MPAKDPRLFIRVHENMPEHPKIEGLTDKAFRLLIDTWCWCSRNRTDGHIPANSWQKRGTPRARTELITAGLLDDDLNGGAIVHDYDQWQRTAAEIEHYSNEKSTQGSLGAHNRWHAARGQTDPHCAYCRTNPTTATQ